MHVISRESPERDKIALFKSLFKGRTDVFPRRFENRRSGKCGYSPACHNEWVRGICEKPRVKCSDCPHQAFGEVDDQVLRWHLSGKDDRDQPFVMGVYPMLLDETCHFLAVDFDKDSWKEDSTAYLATCHDLNLPASLERSRSGNGGHIWFFFDEAVPASLARSMGSALLTRTMQKRPEIGLKSYDRLFPNQDTLPKGGFGNLIALPLQWEARQQGNSEFIAPDFNPFPDQWRFLSNVKRIRREAMESVINASSAHGGIIGVRLALSDDDEEQPWTSPPSRIRKDPEISKDLPKSLEIILSDQIYIAKEQLPPSLRNRLIRLAAFQNPEFYKAQAMRLPTYGTPRIVACVEETTKHLGFPRGCLDELSSLLEHLKIKLKLRDERPAGVPLSASFQGTLRSEQETAVRKLKASDCGVLSAPPAFGKTVVASWLIAQRGVNVLVLVHRKQLQEQWIERLSYFLDRPTKKIGAIGGGRRKATGEIDVAVIQSLIRKGEVDDCVADYGHVIVDECHHIPARSFELLMRRTKARYVLGLSATVARKDGHHPIIFMQCGPIRYRADAKHQANSRPFTHNVIVRPTGFHPEEPPEIDRRMEFNALYVQLIGDEHRNQLIGNDVLNAVKEGRSPIVLTERTQHLELLAEQISDAVKHVIVLQGGLSKRQLKAAQEQLSNIPEREDRVLLATGRFLGEGFDDARLDTLFLTLPVSWRGTITQYAGRLHRLHEGKREVRIYDYADLDVPMLSRMFDRRCQGYDAIGYNILLPASAIPGWPQEVPLPIDPEWKKNYAASVRRLVRDGVDPPLGNLFLHAARTPSSDAGGIERARSASEAFLFKRLQTLPQTKNHFKLNAILDIPFDNQSQMEVDFLCPDGRLVIEIDGDQHLNDPDAYRRDRRKDTLLQEHGYFILRFLATDLGKHLNETLDTILRTLDHCTRDASETKPD